MKIIAISSGKGGVGKTSVVVNVGVSLASHYGKKVIAVDCNLTNPHLGLSLGTLSVWPFTLNDVIRNKARIDQAMYTHASGLNIIPASFDGNDIRRGNMHRLRTRLRCSFETYKPDIVLLDSSPGLTQESLLTLRCSDEVLFVATPHIPSIVDITKCCQLLGRTDAVPRGIVLNRIRGKTYEMSEDEIKNFTRLPIIARIPEDEQVLKSTNLKVPVVTTFPRAAASRAFAALAATLAGSSLTLPSVGSRWGRVFSRFRRS